MKVLLTGGSGFIGRESIRPLIRLGAEVHSISRDGTAPEGVFAHRLDLLTDDIEKLMSEVTPTHLLHFAWYTEPRKFWTAPENLDWVAASLKLVRAFADQGGKRAVLAGSCAEYDWSCSRLDETETQLKPSTVYGESKASLFRIIEKAAPKLGLSFAWGRIFFPYGPFDRSERLAGHALDAIVTEREGSFSEGNQRRDFMHVEDTAAAFVALLLSRVEGAVNVASGEEISIRNFVEHAASLRGVSHLMHFGVRPKQPGEPPVLVANIRRLRQEVGFRQHFDMSAGLRDAVSRRPLPNT